MAERVTKVTLTAQVGSYISGMQRAEVATRATANEAKKLSTQRQDFDALGRSMLAIGAAAAVGVGLAVSKFAEFDKQMSSVQAATHESVQNMGALRDAALDAGAETVFSATEAASAIEEMGKAGIATSDILGGGLKGALDLAAAGELGVGQAAEIAATALTQFNLAGADVPHVADVLAAGAGKAQGSVDDMSQALKQSGLVASQMGLSLEDTVGSLSAFASAGLIGSDAGTSFRAMLLRLANPTDEAKELMDDLGIAAYDAGGQFVGMESLAGQLQERLGGLTQAQRDQALASIFGQDAIRSANILYRQGSDGIEEWTDKVNDAGYAAETAELRMDNLSGDIEKLGGALDTALIKTGSAANDVLRGLVQGAENAVDTFGSAPDGVQTTALAVGALATAAGLAGGAFFLAVPKVVAFKAALATMSPAAQRAAGVLGGIGKAAGVIAGLGIAVSVLDKLSKAGNDAAVGIEQVIQALNSEDLDAGFSNVSGSVSTLAEALELVEGSGFDANMERIGEAIGSVVGVTGEVTEARVAFQTLGDALGRMVSEGKGDQAGEIFAQIAEQADKQGISIDKVKNLMPAYTEALAAASNEQENAAGHSEDLAEGLTDVETAAEEAQSQVDALAEAIRGFGDTQLDVNDATRAVEQSLDDFEAKLAENGATLDITSQAGRDNAAAVDDIARSYIEAAAATVANTGKQEDAIPVIQAGRDAVVAAREALGDSREAAEAYADKLGLIPADVNTIVTADTGPAQASIDNFIYSNDGRTLTINAAVARTSVGNDGGPGGFKDGGRIPHLSGGSPTWWRDGVVSGPGGPRDDRVAAMLSPGEFVVNADATSKHLPLLNAINSGGSGGFGGGGSSSGSSVSVMQLLREIRDRVGVTVPVGAVQGSLGSSNVSNTTRGRI